MAEAVRACTRCKLSFPESRAFFARYAEGRAGLKAACKECDRAWRQKYYSDNPAARALKNQQDFERYHALPEAARKLLTAANVARGRPFAAERSRRKRLKNPEANRAAQSRWARMHPEARRVREARRRARIAGASGNHTAADLLAILQEQNGQCFYCQRSMATSHTDHKIPFARGGSNDRANICLACPSCNARKHTDTDNEFRARFSA